MACTSLGHVALHSSVCLSGRICADHMERQRLGRARSVMCTPFACCPTAGSTLADVKQV